MKALSIKQPWASLIAHGIKDIENRTWKNKYRGRIYIHSAAASVPFNGKANGMSFTLDQRFVINKKWPGSIYGRYADFMSEYPNSCIIGEVDIIGCETNYDSIWAEKSDLHLPNHLNLRGAKPIWNWVLANAVLYDEPILDIKGKLSFWEFDNPKL